MRSLFVVDIYILQKSSKSISELSNTLKKSFANYNWALFLFPLNASVNGLTTILPLFILTLHGSVIDVALSALLINFALVIGSLIWGKILDTTKWRVEIIYMCSIGIAFASLSLLLFPHFIIIIMIVSLMIGMFSIGIEPTTNVIIKERAHGKSNEIIHIFTWTSFIISIGFAFAMVLGYLILIFYDVRYYALVCFVLGSFSLGMSILWTPKKFLKIKKESVLTRPILNFQSLKQLFIIFYLFFKRKYADLFQLFKSANDFPFLIHIYKTNRLLHKYVKYKESKFFISILMYYISSSLMFTPITPF